MKNKIYSSFIQYTVTNCPCLLLQAYMKNVHNWGMSSKQKSQTLEDITEDLEKTHIYIGELI